MEKSAPNDKSPLLETSKLDNCVVEVPISTEDETSFSEHLETSSAEHNIYGYATYFLLDNYILQLM